MRTAPGAKGALSNQLAQSKHATKASLATLKAEAHEAKRTPAGAKSKAHGVQEKKASDLQRAAHAQAKHHQDAAHEHKHARHEGGHDQVPKVERTDAHSPIQFKKISSWSKYLPEAMPDQDERERARILKLVKDRVEGERAQAQKSLAKLYTAQIKQAKSIRAMKPGLQGKVASAQAAALGQVASSEAAQAAAVAAAFTAAKARVNGAASAAKSQVNGAYGATMAAINGAFTSASQRLTQGQTKATTDIGVAETMQIVAVGALYTGARAKVDANGAIEATHAAGLADTVPMPYDGDKLEAAQKTAHDTADGWAKEIPGKMQEEAQKNIYCHQPESEQGTHELAKHQKEQVKTVYDQLKTALETAKTQALAGAATARSQALAQIDSIAASTCASLSAQSAAQVASVHQQAAAARQGIQKAGQTAQAGVAHACDKAAAGLEKGAHGLAKGMRDVETIDPAEAEKKVKDGSNELKTAAGSITSGLNQQASQSAQGLKAQAQGAAQGMAKIAAAAKQSSAQIAQSSSQSITQAGQAASQSLHKMGDAFKKQADSVADGGEKAFAGIVKDTKKAYQDALKSLGKGIDDGVKGLKDGFASAIDKDERQAIIDNAKKAADSVKPWWQKALAFVLVILVAIVITVVVTALTGGLGTGPLMVAMIGIGSGALAGGLSSAAGQIVNNLVMGNGAFDNFSWTEVGIGALAGGLTAGLASGVGAVGGTAIKTALAGASGLKNVAIRTAVDFTTGLVADVGANLLINGKYEFTMENLVTQLAMSTVTSTTKVQDFQAKVSDGIRTKVGLDPINVHTPGVDGGGAHSSSGGDGAGGTQAKGGGTESTPQGGADPGAGTTSRPDGNTKPTGGQEPASGGTKPGEGGTKPGDTQGQKPGDTQGQKPGDTQGQKPDGQGQKPADDAGSKPDTQGGKPGDDAGSKPDEQGGKPDEQGKKPDEQGGKPGDEQGAKPGDEQGQKPADDGDGRSDEQKAHDEARDAELDENGYPGETDAGKTGGDPTKTDSTLPEAESMMHDPTHDPSLKPPGLEGGESSAKVEPNQAERLKALADAINDLRTDNAKRNEVLETLRTPNDGKPGALEGHVLDTALAENQVAIQKMVESLKNDPPDVIVGMKRGGAFLTEVLGKADPDLAGKVHEMDVHKATGDAAKKGKFDQDAMLEEFEVLIRGGATKIAIVDAYMGGRTASSLRDQIMKPLAERYPDVKFEVHWVREMMGLPDGAIRGTVRPSQKGGSQISTKEHQVRMVIGDDMTMVFDPSSTKPITIFDKDGQVLKTFHPQEGQTSRDVLVDLLTGRLTL